MSHESRGVRTLPPALLLALAMWAAMMIARTIFLLTAKEPWGAIRFNLVSDGVGFAAEMLALVGSLELARRLTGLAAVGAKVVAGAFVGVLLVDIGYGLLSYKENLYETRWVFEVADYAYWGVWMLVPIGIAVALWRERRELAIAIVVASVLLWPPAFLAKHLYSWVPDGKAGLVIDTVLRLVRVGVHAAGFAWIARGAATSDRVVAAAGLRTSAKAMWLRLIAALVVPLITLMVIGSKGGKGALEMLKLTTFVAIYVNVFALAQFGIGALRTARGSVDELGRWPFVLGGAASLWGAGVMLGQAPWLYRMLYKRDSLFGGEELTKYAQALSVAMPLIITGGIALMAVAISGLASRRGNDDLRTHAQAKGAGFVTLTLAAVAITNWMIPKAMMGASASSFVMLSLLAAGSMIVAIVMIARLLNLAADELDREPGLPPASLIH